MNPVPPFYGANVPLYRRGARKTIHIVQYNIKLLKIIDRGLVTEEVDPYPWKIIKPDNSVVQALTCYMTGNLKLVILIKW